jgi:hypothetical protein
MSIMTCPYCHRGIHEVIEGKHGQLLYTSDGLLAHKLCFDREQARQFAKKREEFLKAKEARKQLTLVF